MTDPVQAQLSAHSAEISAYRAETEAFRAEVRAWREEVVAWREQTESRFDRLDQDIAVIIRYVMREDNGNDRGT